MTEEIDTTGGELVRLPRTTDETDTRAFVEMYHMQCREGDWHSGDFTEDEVPVYEAQDKHYGETGHIKYHRYVIQRGNSEVWDMKNIRKRLRGEKG